jgi:hypothetical protein
LGMLGRGELRRITEDAAIAPDFLKDCSAAP